MVIPHIEGIMEVGATIQAIIMVDHAIGPRAMEPMGHEGHVSAVEACMQGIRGGAMATKIGFAMLGAPVWQSVAVVQSGRQGALLAVLGKG